MRGITALLRRLVDGLEFIYPRNCWDEGGKHYDDKSYPKVLIELFERRKGHLLATHTDQHGRDHYIGLTMAGTMQYLAGFLKCQCQSRLLPSERWKYSRRFLKILHELEARADEAAVMAQCVKKDTMTAAEGEEAHDAECAAAEEAHPLPIVHPERDIHDS